MSVISTPFKEVQNENAFMFHGAQSKSTMKQPQKGLSVFKSSTQTVQKGLTVFKRSPQKDHPVVNSTRKALGDITNTSQAHKARTPGIKPANLGASKLINITTTKTEVAVQKVANDNYDPVC